MTDKTTPSAAPGSVNEQVLDAELEALQQHWQAVTPAQPPTALDLAVLRQARSVLDEAGGTVPQRSWPWTRKWTHNLATAAVAVVAVTLLLQLREQAPAPLPAAAPAAGRVLEKAAEQTDAQVDAETPEQAARPALRMSAPVAPARAVHDGTVAAERTAVDSEELERLPAAEWLARIEALYARGEREEALRELAQFRAHYPDVELPAYLTTP